MAHQVKHKFVSPKSDGSDTDLVRPSNWNDDHYITIDLTTSDVTVSISGNVSENTITVASASGLYPGMFVTGTGVGTGAYILSIASLTLTLSTANLGAVSGTGSFYAIRGPLAINKGGTGTSTSTGSGNLVLASSPSLTAPTLSSPSISGDFTFTGTGNRITGDFSNATIASRVMFQTSTTNGYTTVGAIPNGTSTSGGFIAYNNSDPTNASATIMQCLAAESRFSAGITGTGTYLPMTFFTGSAESLRIDTDKTTIFAGTASLKRYIETIATPSISSGSLTLDLSSASFFAVSLNSNITTLSLSNIVSGKLNNFVLEFTADGTARTVAWPASFKWSDGTAPVLTSTSGKKDVFAFYTTDNGTSWVALQSGANI